MKSVNLPEDLESPNDKFFNSQMLQLLLNTAGTQEKIQWDQNDVDSLSKKLLEITNAVIKKGGRGYFWLVCSSEIGEILSSSKKFVSNFFEQYPLGYPIIMFMGILDKRWRIYTDLSMSNKTILLGCGFSKKHVNYYANITLENSST